MNSLNPHHESLKRLRWDPLFYSSRGSIKPPLNPSIMSTPPRTTKMKLLGLATADADAIVPPVTVVLEGRSICHLIHLSRHTSYQSLAAALHRMFVEIEGDDDVDNESTKTDGLDLSNAVPGHMVAYEDMEDDLLLAGDLSWKDFVRVAKRIRIIPVRASRRRRHCGGIKLN